MVHVALGGLDHVRDLLKTSIEELRKHVADFDNKVADLETATNDISSE